MESPAPGCRGAHPSRSSRSIAGPVAPAARTPVNRLHRQHQRQELVADRSAHAPWGTLRGSRRQGPCLPARRGVGSRSLADRRNPVTGRSIASGRAGGMETPADPGTAANTAQEPRSAAGGSDLKRKSIIAGIARQIPAGRGWQGRPRFAGPDFRPRPPVAPGQCEIGRNTMSGGIDQTSRAGLRCPIQVTVTSCWMRMFHASQQTAESRPPDRKAGGRRRTRGRISEMVTSTRNRVAHTGGDAIEECGGVPCSG